MKGKVLVIGLMAVVMLGVLAFGAAYEQPCIAGGCVDEGSSYDGWLAPDYSTSSKPECVTVSDMGETISVLVEDMDCGGSQAAYFYINHTVLGVIDDVVLGVGDSQTFSGMELSVSDIFCGADNYHVVEIELGYKVEPTPTPPPPTPTPPPVAWDVKYEANVLPQNDGWTPGCNYSGGAAVSDGILTLNTPDGSLQYWKHGSSSSFSDGITLEARAKVTSPGALSQIGLSSAHYGNKNIMLRYDSVWGVAITSGVYHTIRLTLDDSTGVMTLYVDGEWKKEQTVSSPWYFATLFGNEWWWGGPTASMWDYVYYTSGVHPPQ